MTLLKFICMICEGSGPLRRLKPHTIYVCQACVATHGGLPLILTMLDDWKMKFTERHQPSQISFTEGPIDTTPKPVITVRP